MKKLCISLGSCLLGLVASMPCHAEMTVQFFGADGIVQEIDGALITGMAVSGHTLSVYQNDLPEWTCDTHTIKSIKFKMGSSGVTELLPSEDSPLSFRRDGDLISLEGSSFTLPAAVYSANGALLSRTSLGNGASYDCSSLSRGVYIIKCGDKNYKFIK